MRKISTALTAMLMAASLCGCNEDSAQSSQSPVDMTTPVTEVRTPTESSADDGSAVDSTAADGAAAFKIEDLGLNEENYPRIDGLPSVISLDAGIRASLLGKTPEEVEAQITHTNANKSFERLLAGEVDGILVASISDEQQAAASAAGISLESMPIASEGLVFLVHSQNPVDNLTQQQVKDIYAGKITKWAEIGGNDAPILPYQRSADAGSQHDMIAFMQGSELMEPKRGQIHPGRGSALDLISANDFNANIIGYSVYSYAAEAIIQKGELKFLAIDGVKPNLDTLSDGDYPYLTEVKLVLNAAAAGDAPIRKVAQYLGTQLGKDAISAAGYVPVK